MLKSSGFETPTLQSNLAPKQWAVHRVRAFRSHEKPSLCRSFPKNLMVFLGESSFAHCSLQSNPCKSSSFLFGISHIYLLVGGLVAIFYFPILVGFKSSQWRTHIFQRGGKTTTTTNQTWFANVIPGSRFASTPGFLQHFLGQFFLLLSGRLLDHHMRCATFLMNKRQTNGQSYQFMIVVNSW